MKNVMFIAMGAASGLLIAALAGVARDRSGKPGADRSSERAAISAQKGAISFAVEQGLPDLDGPYFRPVVTQPPVMTESAVPPNTAVALSYDRMREVEALAKLASAPRLTSESFEAAVKGLNETQLEIARDHGVTAQENVRGAYEQQKAL